MKPRSDISISQVSCGAGEPSGWRVNTGASSITVCPVRGSSPSYAPSSLVSPMPPVRNAPMPMPVPAPRVMPAPMPVPSTTPAVSRGLGTLLPTLKWDIPDYKLPWKQMKFNIPEAYTSYATGLYDKIKTILAGQGVADTGTAKAPISPEDAKRVQMIWDRFGVCLKAISTDKPTSDRINQWYTDLGSGMTSTTGMPDEKVFRESVMKLQTDIGSSWAEKKIDEQILSCFFGAVASILYGAQKGMPTPASPPTAGSGMLLDNRW